MRTYTLWNGRVVTPFEQLVPGWVRVAGGRIEDLGSGEPPPGPGEAIDVQGAIVCPGFIDLHVHGWAGASCLEIPDGVERVARALPCCGVTAFVPTLMSAPDEVFEAALRVAADFVRAEQARAREEWGIPAAEPLGVYLEGPCINPEKRGAHALEHLAPPSLERAERWLDGLRGCPAVVTLAPELPGAIQVAEFLCEHGVAVAAGHSAADWEQAGRAARAGMAHVTHLFNGMRTFHHRDPGLVGFALSNTALTLELIGDGVHVHPAVVKLVCQVAGPGRVALITDGIPPAGLGDGAFEVVSREVVVRGSEARLADGTLAGGVTSLVECVRRLVSGGVPLEQAVAMATCVPARVVSACGRKGSLAPGKDADVLVLEPDLTGVKMCFVRGCPVGPW